jgi:hypothetical protein
MAVHFLIRERLMTKNARWVSGALALAGLALAGCHKEQIQTVKNVERAVARWGPDEASNGVPHMCLEYSTAAEKLHDRDTGASVPIGETTVTLSYKDKESLAAIYSVSEIMQFGHAALYRLCEASGNQSIDNEAYAKLFSSTIEQVHGLIELQLLREKLNSVEHLVVLESQLKDLDRERCRASTANSAGGARQVIQLNERRKSLIEDIERLQSVLGAAMTHSLPTDSLPTPAEWTVMNEKATAVLTAREKIDGKTLLDRQVQAQKLLKQTRASAKPSPQEQDALDWQTACTDLKASLTKTDGACEAPVELLETCP